MTPKQFLDAADSLLASDVPVCLWGGPGISKSACVRLAAERAGRTFLDVRLTTMDPVDLRGLPKVVRGKTDWARPAFLPEDGEGVMLLDELGQSSQAMQAAAMQLVLDRRVGDHRIGDGWRILAASNRAEDRAGAGKVITPLLNRFVHLDIEPCLDDWMDWATEAGIDHRVRSFLRWRPSELYRFDPSSGEKAFPTPRSWAMCSSLLGKAAASSRGWMVRGAVGERTGIEFEGYLSLCESLPDMERIWKSPAEAQVPTEASLLFAVGGVLCEGILGDKGTPRRLEAFGTYVSRMDEEMAVAIITDGFRANKSLKGAASVCRFLMGKLHLISDTGRR